MPNFFDNDNDNDFIHSMINSTWKIFDKMKNDRKKITLSKETNQRQNVATRWPPKKGIDVLAMMNFLWFFNKTNIVLKANNIYQKLHNPIEVWFNVFMLNYKDYGSNYNKKKKKTKIVLYDRQ